jgi:hypothetical protein
MLGYYIWCLKVSYQTYEIIMLRLIKLFACASLLVACSATGGYAQTGKISGTVTDNESGDPLPGVNVVIEGTTQGATTDTDGFYSILNVSPGTYTLRASFVGYTAQIVEEVRVNIDLTTTVNFELQEEAVGLDEVVVVSQTPVVQPDVSANVSNLSMQEVENIPVTSVEGVVGMQAGIEPGISIRGSGASEVSFRVDGMNMNNPRDQSPFTGISYTSVKDVQVQTGGFNAEYGNLRSGLINVTTREGPRDHYEVNALYRYSPPAKKYFGLSPGDPDAYHMRPHLDPDVAFVGTHSDESPWDEYTRRQYPQWQGWNAVAESWQESDDQPDLTPQQLQEYFEWTHRKDFSPTDDYEFDATIGGPIPVISEALGDLRFSSSYRQTKTSYIVPNVRDSYDERTVQAKLTSNIASGVKLQLNGLYGLQKNYGGFDADLPPYPWSYSGIVDNLDSHTDPDGLFANGLWSIEDVVHTQLGLDFTHSLSPNTFYKVRIQRNTSAYEEGPSRPRDEETIRKEIGALQLNEAPFGVQAHTTIIDPTGLGLGGWGWVTQRDSTEVAMYTVSSDVTSQLNRYAQVKGGIDFWYTDYDSHHGTWHPLAPSLSNPKYIWHRQTMQGAGYLQSKLEFEGLVANLGVRTDYFKPRGDWWDIDTYERAFADNTLEENVDQKPIDGQFAVSPRLGVSYPVTTDSKLYFNYGHFRNTQQTEQLFLVRTIFGESGIDRIGNPNIPMSKTVAYELGYDQNLFDQYLLRISGYYKAKSDQPRYVNFSSIDGRVFYSQPFPLNYGDVRGLEFTVTRQRGDWVRGFVNYTYMVRKEGNFGFNHVFENPAEMREAVRTSRQHYQERPVPEPYANFNVEFGTPDGFGPEIFGGHLLNQLRLSFLGEWRDGVAIRWTANQTIPGLDHNTSWRDYYMLDMRLSKRFETQWGDARLFVDMNNVLNLKHMNMRSAFIGPFDWEHYMQSLHLPEDTFEGVEEPYLFIYGDDQPGDYREDGVEFHPIEVVQNVGEVGEGHPRPLYYEKDTSNYKEWVDGGWKDADPKTVEQVLDDKAYIDMPNSSYFTFLNPRDVYFGISLEF